MYKTQKRFDEASSLLARMPWLPSPQGTATGAENPPPPSSELQSQQSSAVDGDDINILAVPLGTGRAVASDGDTQEGISGGDAGAGELEERTSPKSSPAGDGEDEQQKAVAGGASASAAVDSAASTTAAAASKGGNGGGSGRSDATPARGAGAARVAGLNKAAAAASAAAAAETAAAAAGAVETGAEAAARAVMERHAEAMRASMNELVGELAVTTATRPSASQDWLDSRVVAAEEVRTAYRNTTFRAAAESVSQIIRIRAVPR